MNMWQVIAQGAQECAEGARRPPGSSTTTASTTTQACPFCGADPPLAVQRAGRFLVGCEAEDCPANPQVSAATLEDAWAGWNRRA
jgi:hypothetical protein